MKKSMGEHWMSKVKDYNMELRRSVLVSSIRAEEMASEVLKNLLRTIRPKSKTLGNQSSSLSFKSKIDLLYDLGDFTKDEYNDFIKFMEIRNQFIHNPDCISFEYLVKETAGMDKFLLGNIPKHFKTDDTPQQAAKEGISSNEFLYQASFRLLFVKVLARLITKRVEYRQGMTEELNRYIDAKVLGDFPAIFQDAVKSWRANQVPFDGKTPLLLGMPLINPEAEILAFERHLNVAILGGKIKVLDYIKDAEGIENQVFKRRTDIEAKIKEETTKK